MRKSKNLEFPKNLLYDIFGEDGLDIQELTNLESYLKSYLSDRNFDIIRLYYKDYMKKSEIAKIFIITGTRVDQILSNAKKHLCSVDFLFHIYPMILENDSFDMGSDLDSLGLRDDVSNMLKKDNMVTVSDIASTGLLGLRSILSEQDTIHLIIRCIVNGVRVSKSSSIVVTENTDIAHLHFESDLRYKLRYDYGINTINDLLLCTRQDLLKLGLNAGEIAIISNLLKRYNYRLGSKQYLTPIDSGDSRSEYDIHNRLVSELNLPKDTINMLAAYGIDTVGELIKCTKKQLLNLDSMGMISFNKVYKIISELGLEFRRDDSLRLGIWIEHARENQKFTIIKGKRTIITSCKKNDISHKLSNKILFAEIVEWYVSAFDNSTICVIVE